jgi:DNA helicase-2/ATP-dependent DNA helicase PcrA
MHEINPVYIGYPQTGGKPFPKRNEFGSKPRSFREEPAEYKGKSRMKRLEKSVSIPQNIYNGTNPSEFSEGDSVEHERFGKGKIISIEGEPPNTTASVDFENHGRKKLLLRFAKLKKYPR